MNKLAMKHLIIIVLVFTTFSCAKAQNKKNTKNIKQETTTFYFVRHAEKDTKPKNNPKLLPSGKARANTLANFFNNIKLDAVYATDFTRTLNTALPTAKSQNLSTKIYDPVSIDYNTFKNNNIGKNVFIVGHSNTIPNFVNAIIGENIYPEIDETNYNNLYIVTITNTGIKYELKTIY